jgi:hypothetical protein
MSAMLDTTMPRANAKRVKPHPLIFAGVLMVSAAACSSSSSSKTVDSGAGSGAVGGESGEGGQSGEGGRDAASDDSSVSGTTGGSAGVGGSATDQCPSGPPRNGTQCDVDDLECEYAGSPCGELARCQDGSWIRMVQCN